MAITASDVLFLKSSSGTSDGGAESATELTSGVPNDLWPDISDALRAEGGSRTKKFFIKNDSGTETMLAPSVWIAEQPAGVAVEIGRGCGQSDDDDNTAGVLTAWSANAIVSLSSSASDSRTATIYGLDASSDPQVEIVALAGPAPVSSVGTYSKVHAVELSAASGSLTVTIKQGAGGTTRGSIGINQVIAWLWVAATTKANGIKVADILPGSSVGVWCRQTWGAGVTAQRPTRQIVAIEENAS